MKDNSLIEKREHSPAQALDNDPKQKKYYEMRSFNRNRRIGEVEIKGRRRRCGIVTDQIIGVELVA